MKWLMTWFNERFDTAPAMVVPAVCAACYREMCVCNPDMASVRSAWTHARRITVDSGGDVVVNRREAALIEQAIVALERIAADDWKGGAWCNAVARQALGLPQR